MTLNLIIDEATGLYLRVRKEWIDDRDFAVALKDIAESVTVGKRGRLLAE